MKARWQTWNKWRASKENHQFLQQAQSLELNPDISSSYHQTSVPVSGKMHAGSLANQNGLCALALTVWWECFFFKEIHFLKEFIIIGTVGQSWGFTAKRLKKGRNWTCICRNNIFQCIYTIMCKILFSYRLQSLIQEWLNKLWMHLISSRKFLWSFFVLNSSCEAVNVLSKTENYLK